MQAIIRAISLFIVRGMQPHSLVEDEHFRACVKAIDPRITLPCRSTLTKTILPELYAEAEAKMLVELNFWEILKVICAEFKIPLTKIVAVVTDNAANILKAIKDILKLKHVPCFAHTLSLSVKAAIHDDPQFFAFIEKCRNIVTFFHSSAHATAKLNMCCGGMTKIDED